MKLSLKEYDAMQSGWRKWINEHMEIAGFKAWGMDFTGKDILEVGCGSGYSASLIVKDHPKSYTGMDIMPEHLENKAGAVRVGLYGCLPFSCVPVHHFQEGRLVSDACGFVDDQDEVVHDVFLVDRVGFREFVPEELPEEPGRCQILLPSFQPDAGVDSRPFCIGKGIAFEVVVDRRVCFADGIGEIEQPRRHLEIFVVVDSFEASDSVVPV